MLRSVLAVCLLMGICLGASVAPIQGADDEKLPTIKEIMKEAFKGPLLKKVAMGDASAEEKTRLVKLTAALGKAEPPKGSADSWKEKNAALMKAAKAAADGKEDAGDMLKKASNCMACHKEHKPS